MARRGRPAIKTGEQTVPVNVRFPVSDFDALCKQAKSLEVHRGSCVSLAEIVRLSMLWESDLEERQIKENEFRSEVSSLRCEFEAINQNAMRVEVMLRALLISRHSDDFEEVCRFIEALLFPDPKIK
jgi:hypothetical protein